jgi:hypothetical protein
LALVDQRDRHRRHTLLAKAMNRFCKMLARQSPLLVVAKVAANQ